MRIVGLLLLFFFIIKKETRSYYRCYFYYVVVVTLSFNVVVVVDYIIYVLVVVGGLTWPLFLSSRALRKKLQSHVDSRVKFPTGIWHNSYPRCKYPICQKSQLSSSNNCNNLTIMPKAISTQIQSWEAYCLSIFIRSIPQWHGCLPRHLDQQVLCI